jgi:hypothetical protein
MDIPQRQQEVLPNLGNGGALFQGLDHMWYQARDTLAYPDTIPDAFPTDAFPTGTFPTGTSPATIASAKGCTERDSYDGR